MSSKAVLQLKGFDDLLEKIQKAGGSVDAAADSCLRQSAQIMESELKAQMQAAGVDGDLINRMPPPKITVKNNRYSAAVGYEKGEFDPRDPSDGHKVVFLNYGTPRRTMHGKVAARGFIQAAKKKARPRIKKAQQETLEKILGRVSK
jgi:hypothetical protein